MYAHTGMAQRPGSDEEMTVESRPWIRGQTTTPTSGVKTQEHKTTTPESFDRTLHIPDPYRNYLPPGHPLLPQNISNHSNKQPGQPTKLRKESTVESRSPTPQAPRSQPYLRTRNSGFERPCMFPGCDPMMRRGMYTPCSEEECTDWCHYDPCYTRFCDASEFYPGLDPNPLRQGLMVAYCYACAHMNRREQREAADARARAEYEAGYYYESESETYDSDLDVGMDNMIG